MNRSAITHHSFLPFRQALARDRVRFRLLAASGDVAACSLVYWKRSSPEARRETPLRPRYDDGLRSEWIADVDFPEEAHYVKYFFRLSDAAGLTLYACEYGVCEAEPQGGFYELLQVNEGDVPAIPAWAGGCVYYQIFPERYAKGDADKRLRDYEPWDSAPTRDNYLGGDLRGMREKLPYLQALGVECLYLNPVFAGDFNHKYATIDYYRVDPDFGGNDELIAFVDAAHRHGMRVLLDGVFNHVGLRFPPFEDIRRNGAQSRYAKWFYPKRYPVRIEDGCYECVGDYPYMPRLRVREPEVRQYALDVMLYWLRTARIDGWRIDVADELDESALRFWREHIKAEFPDALLLAETWGDASRLVNAGDMFDSAMNYLFRDAAVDFFATAAIDAAAFDRRIQGVLMKHPDAVNHAMYNCLGSHDTERFLTACRSDERRARLAYAFQMLFIGSPAIYYGDELGMAGDVDPGCRAGMPWERADCELHGYLRRLIAMRKEHSAIRSGGYRTLVADGARGLFAFERYDDQERVRVAFNTGDAPQTLDFADMAGTIIVSPMSVEINIIKGGKPHA